MFNLDKFISDSVTFRPVSMFAADIEANKEILTEEIKGKMVTRARLCRLLPQGRKNDMAYFTVLLRYIHQNPLKAGVVEKVKDYEYSSWGEYQGTVELNEQREQNQMNLSYAKSRGKSTKSTSIPDM